MKQSSERLIKLEEYIENSVSKVLKSTDSGLPYMEASYRVNDRKLESGLLSMMIQISSGEGRYGVKENLNVVMSYTDKMSLYNIMVLESEQDGLKILYTYSSSDIDDIMNSSEAYIESIVNKLVKRLVYAKNSSKRYSTYMYPRRLEAQYL